MAYGHVEDGFVGLTAPSLHDARGIADSLAEMSHIAECNDGFNDWESIKREKRKQ
jgi:hypothetical protein